jgi:prepilin-type N-terminal cleavage/methylation domain-containing protein
MRGGFTLIEILTVIAIIAVLMAMLMPTLRTAKIVAQKADAKNDLTMFVSAVNSFKTDYGVYPIDPAAEAGGPKDIEYGCTGKTHNQDIVNVLRGDTDPADTLASGATPTSINTHGGVYLEVPLVKDNTSPKSGLSTTSTQGPYQNGKGGDWYDPWGAPYIVAIDGDYDGYVDAPAAVLLQYEDVNYVHRSGGGNAVQLGCIAGSFGVDRGQGTAGNRKYVGSDDVVSWQ